jgi:hypothetical protein
MSTFDWRNAPSETAQAIKPSPKTRKPVKGAPIYGLSKKADEISRVRFGGAYSKAVPK